MKTRHERMGERTRYALARTAAALVATAGMCLPAMAQDASRTRAQPENPKPGSTPPASPGGVSPPAIAQPGTAPGATGPKTPASPPHPLPPPAPAPGGDGGQVGADEVKLTAFPEAVELRALVEWVADTLNINISASDQLTGTIVIKAPVTVKRTQLVPLLNSLLEQQGFTIFYDDQSGWYRVTQAGDVVSSGETTRVIPTPGIKPSSLTQLVTDQLGKAGVQLRVTYVDDLGFVLFTDTPRRVQVLDDIVTRLLERIGQQEFIRFDLQHAAATVARARVLELLGTASSGTGLSVGGQQVPPPPAAGAGAGVATLGLADRLNVDPQGNALVLRGYPDEAVRIQNALAVIDRPNTLEYHQYFAGSAASQIADLAQRSGWGRVETIDSTPVTPTLPTNTTIPGGRPNNPANQNISLTTQQQPSGGGPLMIVDTARGVIFYYGTSSQHQQLAGLIKMLDTEREQVIIAAYKLKNVQSDDAAGLLAAVIGGGGTGTSGSSFLPGFNQNNRNRGTSSTPSTTAFGSNQGNQGTQTSSRSSSGGGGRQGGAGVSATGISPFGNAEVTIISDRSNNQVLVRAPGKQQEDWAKLIAKIDQRRPQVYIEVQIVAVSASDDFRLAFEFQGINSGGAGGAVNTNFGLGTLSTSSSSTSGGTTTTTTSDNFLMRKNIVSSLGGITAAVIKADQVPVVLNALKRDTDTRILSSPQLLVDDNEMAEIVSLEEQPTTSVSQGTSTTQTSFQGFEPAGTRLNVTPSISDGGYMRLSYVVELSNFVGTSSTSGIPPVRQTRSVNSDSVTIPGDTTIVVGGIKVDSRSNTIAKVPLLGDIPILGYLFRDTNIQKSNTRLYVFITPRILRDPNFRDLTLLTKGPQAEAGIAPDVPELKPAFIEMLEAPETPADRPGGLKFHGGT